MPKHEWTMICEDFTVTETGTFSIIGCFHDLFFPGFPGKTGKFSIVSSFLGDEGETFNYSIRFFDPHLNRIVESNPAIYTCGAKRFGGCNCTIRQPFDGLVINGPGEIIFEIIVDGKIIHKDALYINDFEVKNGGEDAA